jgi:hypothetical protein
LPTEVALLIGYRMRVKVMEKLGQDMQFFREQELKRG